MIRTLKVFLTPNSSFYDVKEFLEKCQDIAEQHQAKSEHGTFIRSLTTIFQNICEKTDLKPVYMRCEIRTAEKKHFQTHAWMMLWSPQCTAIALGVFTGIRVPSSFLVRATPNSMLPERFKNREFNQPTIYRLFSLWQPLSLQPPCFSLPYHKVPLKYAVVGGQVWAVSPWITAESERFIQEPGLVAARVVQYLDLARAYDSITDRFAGTDVPQHLRIRPEHAEYLMVGYVSRIEPAPPPSIHVDTNYTLMMCPWRQVIHPVKREGDTCVLFDSFFHTRVDLDSDGDFLVSFLVYPVVGDEKQPPLADIIVEGRIPLEIMEKIYRVRKRRNLQRGGE